MAKWTEENNWEDSYSGRFSFMRMPLAENADGADIAVLGIPLDMTTTGRPGARFGPRAIREQSLQAGEFEWGLFPWEYEVRDEFRCVDLGDVTGFTAYTDRVAPAIEKRAAAVLETGASLLSLGGDHFISLPLLRAHAKRHGRPLRLIHFDAHSDTWESEDLNHGTMFYHAIREGLIDPDHSVQVGLRTPNPETWGIRIWHADACFDTHPDEMAKQIRAHVGDGLAYITFDIDCLDPSYAPGTGTPVVGGPTTGWARRVLKGLAGLKIVGGDQVEVSPHYDGPSQVTALAGATIAGDILYLVAGGRRALGLK
jgi:agmatinase